MKREESVKLSEWNAELATYSLVAWFPLTDEEKNEENKNDKIL